MTAREMNQIRKMEIFTEIGNLRNMLKEYQLQYKDQAVSSMNAKLHFAKHEDEMEEAAATENNITCQINAAHLQSALCALELLQREVHELDNIQVYNN